MKKNTLTQYSNAVVGRAHNKRVTVKAKDKGLILEFEGFFKDAKASEQKHRNWTRRGKRYLGFALTDEAAHLLMLTLTTYITNIKNKQL